jgi:hypothetical protein
VSYAAARCEAVRARAKKSISPAAKGLNRCDTMTPLSTSSRYEPNMEEAEVSGDGRRDGQCAIK